MTCFFTDKFFSNIHPSKKMIDLVSDGWAEEHDMLFPFHVSSLLICILSVVISNLLHLINFIIKNFIWGYIFFVGSLEPLGWYFGFLRCGFRKTKALIGDVVHQSTNYQASSTQNAAFAVKQGW
jgi:hypothetical protein